MKFFALMTIFLGSISAQAVCFHDRTSYQEARTKLPPIMQKGTVTLVHNSKNLVAGVRIFPAGQKFKVESHIWHAWMGIDQGEDEVREICYDGGQARIATLSGSRQELRVQGQKVEIKGYTFKPGSMSDFRAVVNDISVRNGPR